MIKRAINKYRCIYPGIAIYQFDLFRDKITLRQEYMADISGEEQ